MSDQTEATAERSDAKRPPSRPPVGDVFCPFPERLAQMQQERPMSGRTRANVERALELIDPAERQAFLDKHRDDLQSFDDFSFAKYADFAYWAYRSVLRAEWLGLDRSPPLDILDIGMGAGSFGMVAKSMGHRVAGTDLDRPWYRDFDKVARVARIIAAVRKGEPYRPVENRRFDLITIMLPNFHRRQAEGCIEYWTMEDWRFFLGNLVRDLLKPGGRIYLSMPSDRLPDGAAVGARGLVGAARSGGRADARWPLHRPDPVRPGDRAKLRRMTTVARPGTSEEFLRFLLPYAKQRRQDEIRDMLALTRRGGFRAPEKILIILFQSRAGSNYFGQLLSSTGWFNMIGESFSPPQLVAIRDRERLGDLHDAAQWMIDHRGTEHAFGFKAGFKVLTAAAELGFLHGSDRPRAGKRSPPATRSPSSPRSCSPNSSSGWGRPRRSIITRTFAPSPRNMCGRCAT